MASDLHLRSLRSRAVAEECYLRGEWPGGKLPFGFRWNRERKCFTVVPCEVEAVQTVFHLYLEGLGIHRIAEHLNYCNVAGPGERHWTGDQVARILRNRFYCGYMVRRRPHPTKPGEYVEEARKSDKLPSAVSEEQWQRVQQVRAERNRPNGISLNDLLKK